MVNNRPNSIFLYLCVTEVMLTGDVARHYVTAEFLQASLIRQVLEHLWAWESGDGQAKLPPERAPPQIGLFGEA